MKWLQQPIFKFALFLISFWAVSVLCKYETRGFTETSIYRFEQETPFFLDMPPNEESILIAQKTKKVLPKSAVQAKSSIYDVQVATNRGENSLVLSSSLRDITLSFVIADEFGRIIFFGDNYRNGARISLSLFARGNYSIFFSGSRASDRHQYFSVGY